MKAVKLEVQPREAKKRNRNKVIRAAGRVPGVVYGGGENHLVEVDNKIFENIVHSASSDTVLLDLKLEGNNHLALVCRRCSTIRSAATPCTSIFAR